MRVFFTSNADGGFSDWVDVTDGSDVTAFLSARCPDCDRDNCMIRINGAKVGGDTVLQNNDRLTITPTKIEGGR